MYETYHPSSDLSTVKSRFVFYRWMHPSSLTLRRDKACDKVGFCDEYAEGVYDCIRPLRRREYKKLKTTLPAVMSTA